MSSTDTRRANAGTHDNGGNEPTASAPAAPASGAPVKQRHKIWRTLALAGPAFVVGAWQFGPGNLASAVQAGSGYGYALIWVIVVSTILMIFFTDMSVRLGMRSPLSLIQSIKDELGKPVGVIAGIGVFFITLMFSVGNAVGSGLGLSLLLGGSPILWTVACTVVVFAILLFRNVYRAVEKLLITIVAVMAVAFIVSAIISNAAWAQAAAGLMPSFPAGSEILIVALVGTNFSINAAFYNSYGIKERGHKREQYRDVTFVDTIPGIVAPGIMTILVIIVAAAVLGQTGEEARTVNQLAAVFEPLAGPVGSAIFALGLAGAAFSSMIANATAGGTMLSDALGHGASSGSRTAKIVSAIILLWGIGITLAFQESPVGLIIMAQALTVLVAPLLGALLIIMSNRRGFMGELRNTWWKNVFAAIGFIAILATSVRLVMSLVS
ncbi:NRAMP (natural resistance-associated macrophage protein) metal ion transporters [Agrococcus baldri]|uniref:NRAMP (Natural resistance-associated macrophage protein) metal ion transporters n=1 Tax=Agrococcus baldri TaxID=153730 RepID=A0AA94HMM7_9MICO|nr:Nramp family divalent metal transporter [Agrococcus baldri]SFS11357.1 NRAMP (natural resistance-associated macrophage protein) metal ion transporters [Agrococcus baldri]